MKHECGLCNFPIQDLEPGADPIFTVVDGKQVPVHTDCYYAYLGDEIEKHPIGGGAPRRG